MVVLEVNEIPYDEELLAHQEPVWPISEWQGPGADWDGHEEKEQRQEQYAQWRRDNPIVGAWGLSA